MQCRYHAAQLGRTNEEYVKARAQILVILGEDLEKAKSYAEIVKAPFPILADPDRAVYEQFALTKNFVGLQRTASIVVDPKGVITYIKRAFNPMTWLQENQELLEAAKA